MKRLLFLFTLFTFLFATNAHANTPTQFGLTINPHGNESLGQAYDRIQNRFGTPDITRVYSQAPDSRWRDCEICVASANSGTDIIYSMQVMPSQVMTGRYNEDIVSFLRSAPHNVKIYFVYWHEAGDEISNRLFSIEQYRAATSYLAPVINRGGGIPSQIITHMDAVSTGSINPNTLFVPSTKVLIFDVFNTEYYQNSYRSSAEMINPLAAVAQRFGKPWGIAEFGSGRIDSDPTGRKRAVWLEKVGALAQKKNARFVNYWNRESLPNGGLDQRMNLDDRFSATVWRNFIRR